MYYCKGIGSMHDNLQAQTIGYNDIDFTPRLDSNIFNDFSVPAVYLEWLRLKVTPINGMALSINIGLRQLKPSKYDPLLHDMQLPQTSIKDNNGNNNRYTLYEPDEDEKRMLRAIESRRRDNDEECIIPNKVLHRFTVNGSGALIVSFSHSGHLLAVASLLSTNSTSSSSSGCSSTLPGNNIYSIFLFNIFIQSKN